MNPTFACHGPSKPGPLDKIIERDGPYIKHWCRLTTLVQPYITKRDIAFMQDGRCTAIYKHGDKGLRVLVLVDGKPKWRKATIDAMYLHDGAAGD